MTLTQEAAIALASDKLNKMTMAILKDHPIQVGVEPEAVQAIVNVNLLAQLLMLENRLSQLDTVEVPIVLCEYGTLPKYKKPGDAGADIYANPLHESSGERVESVWLEPRSRVLIHSGFKIALPHGYRARIESRSGIALSDGIEVGAGLIDQGYRGEVGVILHNHTDKPFLVERGLRIAQICVEKMTVATWKVTDDLPPSERGALGWGSSGLKDEVEP